MSEAATQQAVARTRPPQHTWPELRGQCSCVRQVSAIGMSCGQCAKRERSLTHEAMRASAGTALDSGVRVALEPRFRRDFSTVRIHADEPGHRMAETAGAHAVAMGRDIAFGRGRYAPNSRAGRSLIAHELAHVVQQWQAHSSGARVRSTQAGELAEREASAAARAAMHGVTVPRLTATELLFARGFGDDDPALPKLRSEGLSEAEWVKIRKARKFFNLPERPTQSNSTIVGVIVTESGEEMYVKSGEDGGPWGGTHRGSIPRGQGEGFTGGGASQGNIAVHIEGHTAAIMHQRGITRATLLSEAAPCRICDPAQGWDPESGDWGDSGKRRASPTISQALPPGAKLTIVDPQTTGHYSSDKPAPVVPRTPPPGEEGAPRSGNAPPKETKPPAGKLPGPAPEPALPKLPEGRATPKLAPKGGRAGGVKARTLRGVGNIAVDLAALVATVVLELVVLPKLRSLIADLEAQRRAQLEKAVQEKFKLYEAEHIGRIVEACYLSRLREIEKTGKSAYVNVELYVSFEDTSGRFQLFEETPPESLFDLEFYDVDLKNVWLSTEPESESASELARCENCGTFGRDKSFMTNNPLWQQVVTFSFVAPKAEEIAHEFEPEPDMSKCVANVACFVATACYGSALAPEVETLRRFRDHVLLQSAVGCALVRIYYAISPPVARWLIGHSESRRVVREGIVAPLARLVHALRLDEGSPR